MTKKLNIAIIGSKFMGRSHSTAYLKVHHFFDMPVEPVMKVACGRNEAELRAFADQFGWEEIATDWREVVARPDIDVIDICTSNATHMPIAIEAAKHGKHVICEKPLAMDAEEARQMLSAAQTADVRHMVAFNYRRVPAIQLAKQMIDEGKIGRVFHFNAVYYQDWIVDP
jgi:predicted dehydrogenase